MPSTYIHVKAIFVIHTPNLTHDDSCADHCRGQPQRFPEDFNLLCRENFVNSLQYSYRCLGQSHNLLSGANCLVPSYFCIACLDLAMLNIYGVSPRSGGTYSLTLHESGRTLIHCIEWKALRDVLHVSSP